MIQLIVIGMLLCTVVWFTYAGFMAASFVGRRWLPAVAFASIVGAPFLLALLSYGVFVRGESEGGGSNLAWSVASGSMEFSRYALLALMLYLIAKRLPEGRD